MRSNVTAMLITAGVMLAVFALFSFFHTSVEDAGALKDISFFTPTPETLLIEGGWWSEMPTPIHVEQDPLRKKP